MRGLRFIVAALAALTLVSAASASQVINTSTGTDVTLGVNDKGEAMVTYTSAGKVVHVLAWGAVNAIPPTQSARQVAFSLAYDGGYEKVHKNDPAAQALLAELRDVQAQMAKATSAKNTRCATS